MKTKRNTIIITICITLGIIIIAGCITGIYFTSINHRKGTASDSWAIVYVPNNSVNYNNGDKLVKYLNYNENDSSVKLSFINNASDAWKPRLDFMGIKPIEGTETEEGFFVHRYHLVNKSNDFLTVESDTSTILYDELVIIVDGRTADDCLIPADGKEHIVEIDYSFFQITI